MTLRTILLPGLPRAHSAHHENVLGTSLELRWVSRAWRAGPPGARIERAALAEIRRLDAVFSTFRPESEFSRWMASAGREIEVSPELARVLELAAWWRTKTLGAFDPGCAGRLRPGGGRDGSCGPDSSRTSRAARPLWEVSRPPDGEPPVARKLTSAALTLDAVAKGYIVDRACSRAARAARVSDMLVNIGGDIRHIGENRVVVGVTDPRSDAENGRRVEYVGIRNQGLATSGGYRRGRIEAGRWRSHLVDPGTGQPAERVLSASVIAPDAATADVLATAFSVLRPRRSLEIADSMPGVGCLLLRSGGVRIANAYWERRVVAEPAGRPVSRRRMLAAGLALGLGLQAGRRKAGASTPRMQPRARVGARVQPPWDERFELAITFTIGDPRGGMRARRPYVVVYIDDAEANPVRTVSLWAQDASWVRELRRWYRGERARSAAQGTSLLATVTSPTRNPGRYTVVWDGRDDLGELVSQGEYFVCLETIRQGSSDYFTREPFTLEATPFVAQMEPYGTFREIELDFRERS